MYGSAVLQCCSIDMSCSSMGHGGWLINRDVKIGKLIGQCGPAKPSKTKRHLQF